MSEAETKPTVDQADPVLARFLLGEAVRQLRERDGRGPNALAQAAHVSPATWKRWMRDDITQWGAQQILTMMAAFGYGYNDAATLQLLGLASEARAHNVTSRPEWARSMALDLLVSLERVSEDIRTFELTVVPGLLQTEEYARSHLVLAGFTDALEERVQLRMGRQRILAEGVQFAAVVDEAVLCRAPDPAVMRGQLAHLLHVAERPNVTILVIPFTTGPYFTDGNGPYTILDSARVGRRITSVETSFATMYLETPEANNRYADAWARLVARASGPAESLTMIRSLL